MRAGRVAPTLPGQIDLTLDKWRRLTSVLVYDHKLQPGMTTRVQLMQQAARVRRESLASMSRLYGREELPLNDELVFLNDSVQYIRQILLGVPAARRQRPRRQHHDFSALTPEVTVVQTLPDPHGIHNPLYILDGEFLPSDPSSGAAPAVVRALKPEQISRIAVLKPKRATELYGPRAHDGAVVIVTQPGAK
ncbi:SusC/RagA family TonB-linked outer membrane protein [Hymenobacter persicinus]|uniref:TonB-dependent receptor plug domain-containing protein n=1 Tax=Hymenobacter persicinus TaxID=2025506 RepID=A0A4Q5LEX5_9BACT|nr:hypothetical protein [Hymenobacter persicinus]RYU79137.1 hypothetical protein EWM57_11430 [Hymenobacter persicinus]